MMQPQILLEPPAGAATTGSARRAFSSPPWQVEIAPWPQTGTPLPPPDLHPEEEALVGTLPPEQMEAWSEELLAGGYPELGYSLRATLKAHRQPPPPLRWEIRGRSWHLDLSRPRLMGVVNVTPDSFSDGGHHATVEAAVTHALALADAGADLLDIGGESTRPGADPVPLAEELARVIPVLRAVTERVGIPVSVDTRKAAVMNAALEAGAAMINDVTALTHAPEAAERLAGEGCPVVLMHMQGIPATMQAAPRYGHVTREVYGYLAQRLAWCVDQGIRRDRLLVDPGIGFGKNADHNLELLHRLRVFHGLGAPLLVGVSRKRIVGHLTGIQEPAARDPGSHVLAALAALHGAQLLRVHDVAGARQALAVAHGWMGGTPL